MADHPSDPVRQILSEGVLLAACGGVLALIAGSWARYLIVANYPGLKVFAVDYRVFAYTMLVSIAAGLILGFAPALSGRGKDPNQALAGRDTAGRGLRLRSLLVCQLAFALMLLASTGLLVKAW